jgi:hypothetical protein
LSRFRGKLIVGEDGDPFCRAVARKRADNRLSCGHGHTVTLLFVHITTHDAARLADETKMSPGAVTPTITCSREIWSLIARQPSPGADIARYAIDQADAIDPSPKTHASVCPNASVKCRLGETKAASALPYARQ